MIECKLVSSERQTAFGPLCLLGHFLTQERVLEPLSGVKIAQKTVKHTPQQKLTDALMGILCGCKAIYQTNARVRPDAPLTRAFGRRRGRVADQSTIQRTLDAFSEENVEQLRGAVEAIGDRHSRLLSHPYEREMLLLEVDLTGLRASKRAQRSTKGYFSGSRNATGRQLARASAPLYGEVPFCKLHPGNTGSCEVLKGTIKEIERLLKSTPRKRKRTLVRLDGGFGTDENLEWLCSRGYQLVAKGYHGGRAKKLARSVPEEAWQEGPTAGQSLAVVAPEEAPGYSRETKTVLRRWTDKEGKPYADYLITTLTRLSASEVAELYDRRGGMESDIKGDKRGLGIEERRKKNFHAQEALALLAQLAHNVLAWFKGWFLRGTKAAELGQERMVRDVLAMPAEVRRGRFSGALRLRLPHLHPWAKAVAAGTRARSIRDGRRTFWRKN